LAQKSNKLPWELFKKKQKKHLFDTGWSKKHDKIAPQQTEKNAKHNEV